MAWHGGGGNVNALSLRIRMAALAAGFMAASVPAAWADTSPASDSERAMWAPKELRFIYQGFTARYSCDGLRDKVRSALLALGARREDLSVTQTACTSVGRPDPFPGVAIKMQVLKPADTQTAASLVVPAHWKTVDLRLDRDSLSQAGDCELLEQIKQKILPLFSTRKLDYSSNCIPHQLSTGGTRLSVEVLVSDAPDRQPAATAGR